MMHYEDAKKQVILDCDNTFGLPGLPMDDGLALLYLLGHPGVRLIGITCTHGNSDTESTYQNTKRMLQDIGREDIPVYKGNMPHESALSSEAAEFLASKAAHAPGKIYVLATGAMTNLADAFAYDTRFFENLAGITSMGGLTEPLFINGIGLDELNYSIDVSASYQVFEAASSLFKHRQFAILTGTNCLPAYMSLQDFQKRLNAFPAKTAGYILQETENWFQEKIRRYGLAGFYNWDTVAAAYLCEPELFRVREHHFIPDLKQLSNGYLLNSPRIAEDSPLQDGSSKSITVLLPEVNDPKRLLNNFYTNWARSFI